MSIETLKNEIKKIAGVAFDPKKLNEAKIKAVQKLLNGVSIAKNSLQGAQNQLANMELTVEHAENAVSGAQAKLEAKLKELEAAYPGNKA